MVADWTATINAEFFSVVPWLTLVAEWWSGCIRPLDKVGSHIPLEPSFRLTPDSGNWTPSTGLGAEFSWRQPWNSAAAYQLNVIESRWVSRKCKERQGEENKGKKIAVRHARMVRQGCDFDLLNAVVLCQQEKQTGKCHFFGRLDFSHEEWQIGVGGRLPTGKWQGWQRHCQQREWVGESARAL